MAVLVLVRPRIFTRQAPGLALVLTLPILTISALASILFGTADIRVGDVLAAFVAFDGSPAHLIIRTVRVPRALIAIAVGGGLAVSGAIMQALTRNPLASPGILGINAGAAMFVVVAIFVLKTASLLTYVAFAFVGAAATAALVLLLGAVGRGTVSPLRLTVAGAAVTALFSSLTQALLVLHERTLDEMRFWLAGSVAGRDLGLFVQVLPFMAAGFLGALLMGRQITTLSLGDDIARGLGQRTGLVRTLAALIVVLLAGGAVAIAGPIGFIGLAVPHVTRALVGTDYRWIVPHAAVQGGILLLVADVAARFIVRPEEAPVGVMTALIGAPFFVYMARRQVAR